MIKGEIFDGRYRILEVIGRGGTSTVYLAENVKLGTLWAIKEIQRKGIKQIDFLAEPNMLKKLNHPALPRIFDIIEGEEQIYIIVDYIEGKNLLTKLQEEGRFTEANVINWAKQLCEVLYYLHSQNPHPIIYRDMKPSNIILSSNGCISLIDFGIAREFKPESNNDTVYIGTKGYAAPEQYGSGQTNKTTDIYSLGVTLYHLLTGKNPNCPPYDIKPVRSLIPELSSGIEKIISKCIQLNSADRYQDVEELLQDLVKISEPHKNNHNQDQNQKNQDQSWLQYKKDILSITEHRSFKRLVISIPDNCEFACEFAYVVSKQTRLKLLIVDMNYPVHIADIYLPLKKPEIQNAEGNDFGRLFGDKLCRNDQTVDWFSAICRKCRGAENLHILQVPYEEDGEESKQVEKIIDFSYRHYDLTILVINKSNYEASRTAVLRSDMVLAAATANTDILRTYEEFLELITEGWGVTRDSFKYIAYEYKKGISASPSLLKRIFDKSNFFGYITYYPEREKCRNIRAYFCEDYLSLIKEEYTSLMEALGIVQKKTAKELFLKYLSNKTLLLHSKNFLFSNKN